MQREQCYNCGGAATDKYYLVPKKQGGKPVYMCATCCKAATRNISSIAQKQALVVVRQMRAVRGVKVTKDDIARALDTSCPYCNSPTVIRKGVNPNSSGEPLRIITTRVCEECERWGKDVAAKRAAAEGR